MGASSCRRDPRNSHLGKKNVIAGYKRLVNKFSKQGKDLRIVFRQEVQKYVKIR